MLIRGRRIRALERHMKGVPSTQQSRWAILKLLDDDYLFQRYD